MEMAGSSESHLLKIGLKFGEEIYFEDVGVGGETKSEGGLSPVAGGGGGGGGGPQKKGRTGGGQVGLGQGQQPPRCQVEGCNLDLSDAKTYYSRHKVCGVHSKTAKVIVNGLEQRFCQQCSRFHQLPEFDQGKRSCRRRLAGHNERRRKPTSGSLLSARYGSLPSSLFENNGNGGSFLMDFSSCSRAPPPPRAATGVDWSTTRAPPPPPLRAANDLPITTEKFPPLPWQSSLDNPPPYINPNVPPGVGCLQDSNCALSLLSNHSTTGSTNQTLSLEYSWFNPDAAGNAPMVQPPNGTMVHGHFSSTTAWGYDTNEAHSHLGLGQIPQSGYNSGELGLGQQGGRRYDSSADHIDWSL